MKKMKLALVAAMVCTMVAISVAPVYAASFESDGDAGFGNGTVVDPINPVDPEKPDPEVGPEYKPDLPGTGDTSIVSLNNIPSFKFGDQLKVSTQEVKYPSLITSTVLGAGGKYDAPFIQVTDQRGVDKYNGWNVTLKSGAFVVASGVDAGKELKGARLSIATGRVNSILPASAPKPTANAIVLDAAANSTAKTIFSAGNGVYGLWVNRLYAPTLEEGKTFAKGSEFKNDYVQLVVPAYQAIPGANYKVKMSWALNFTP